MRVKAFVRIVALFREAKANSVVTNVCRALRHNTARREAMRMNSLLPAVLFLAWSIRREAQQA